MAATRTGQDLDAVLRAAATGDDRAIAELVERCQRRVSDYATSRGASEPDAIANMVMTDFVNKVDRLSFESEAHVWAYLFRVARSRIVDELRKDVPEPAGDLRGDHGADVLDFEDATVERLGVTRALTRLTDKQREVLELRYLSDLSIHETARRTGMSPSAVKAVQRRALRTAAGVIALAVLIATLAVMLVYRPETDYLLRPASTPPSTELAPTPAPDADAEQDDANAGPGPEAGPEVNNDDGSRVDDVSGDAEGTSADVVADDADTTASTDNPESAAPALTVPAATSDDVDTVDVEPPEGEPDPNSVAGVVGDGPPGVTVPSELDLATIDCASVADEVALYRTLGFDVRLGTEGADTIDVSSSAAPVIVVGFGGNDVITTGSGDDLVCAGEGDDVVTVGQGADLVWAGAGDDRVFGQGGDDRLEGEAGNDYLDGGNNNDVVRGGVGNDDLFGGDNDDRLEGANGEDVLWGGGGADRLQGGDDGDVLDGGLGKDRLFGGNGDDRLEGGTNDDELDGGDGFDTLSGEHGNDTCLGEAVDSTCEILELRG